MGQPKKIIFQIKILENKIIKMDLFLIIMLSELLGNHKINKIKLESIIRQEFRAFNIKQHQVKRFYNRLILYQLKVHFHVKNRSHKFK